METAIDFVDFFMYRLKFIYNFLLLLNYCTNKGLLLFVIQFGRKSLIIFEFNINQIKQQRKLQTRSNTNVREHDKNKVSYDNNVLIGSSVVFWLASRF